MRFPQTSRVRTPALVQVVANLGEYGSIRIEGLRTEETCKRLPVVPLFLDALPLDAVPLDALPLDALPLFLDALPPMFF